MGLAAEWYGGQPCRFFTRGELVRHGGAPPSCRPERREVLQLFLLFQRYGTSAAICLLLACLKRPSHFSHSLSSNSDESVRASNGSGGSMTPRAAKSVARLEAWNGNGHMRATSLEDNSFVLVACEDSYGGMVVDAGRLPSDMVVFARSLVASLAYWKSVVRCDTSRVAQKTSPVSNFVRCLWQ